MTLRPRNFAAVPAIAAAFLTVAAASSTAIAQEVVVRERVYYPIEVEPHFSFGEGNVYGATGFGGGLRIGIPLAVGHVGRVADNIAISFGADLLHYENCYGAGCGANYLMLPVAAQWNLLVARRFSLLLEGGAYVYNGWYGTCGPNCDGPSSFGVLPTVAVGGRVHLHDNVAFLFRVGYPMITAGVSFF